MSIYLGIDAGTQSVKALLYDADARKVLATAQAELELISGDDGTREQHAEWWLLALQQCISDLRQSNGEQLAAIRAIGVSGQQHGFVPLDASGNVLTPVKLWCDTSTTEECAEITDAFGGEAACIDQVGNAVLTGYTAPKIRWLKKHNPQAYKKLAHILLPHDYLNFFLTGEIAMEHGDASGTGLLDVRARDWHQGMLAAVDADRDLGDCLPSLLEAGAQWGAVSSQAAAFLGLPAGVAVSTGGGDNMIAAIGTGSVLPGRLTISLGTSGTLFAFSNSPIVDDDGQLAAFCSSTGGWLPLLCTMNCTVATEMARDLFNTPLEEIESRVASIPIGSEGVITLPFYNGERTPNLPNGKACIMGMTLDNCSEDGLLRSAMEGACFGLRAGQDAFMRLGYEVSDVRLTGGGAKNASWRQMIADVFSAPVDVLAQDEGAALGAALQALWMEQNHSGHRCSITEVCETHLQVDESRGHKPIAEHSTQYGEHYQHYQRYVALLSPAFK